MRRHGWMLFGSSLLVLLASRPAPAQLRAYRGAANDRDEAVQQAIYFERVSTFDKLPVEDHARHARRAFTMAKALVDRLKLPSFKVRMPGGETRLVINVHGEENLNAYCNAFSEKKGFMEHYFCASTTDKPTRSYLRVGNRSWDEYGKGEDYRMWINEHGRIAFPFSVSRAELEPRMDAFLNTPSPPFDWSGVNVGGIHKGEWLRNCTDWVTVVNGMLTMGRNTNSLLDHARSLWDRRTTPRMTVMAVITQDPIPLEDFTAEKFTRGW